LKSEKVGRKADYSKIKRKLYSYVLIAILAAAAFVVFLRYFIHWLGGIGNGTVRLMEIVFGISYDEAIATYNTVIRGNAEIIISITILVCFFLLCHFIVSNFMKYFDETNSGIDSLIRGEDAPVELSPEMDFMEQKLNKFKQTVEKREQDAKLAEQRKNDLVMYLAHDIKTPLTSVIGYLSLLDEAPDMPAEQKAKYVNITLEKANRLEKLVDEFFEITRYNFQTIALSKESIDLYYMLAQMTDEFYPLLAANGKQAVLHVPEDMAVYGDPDKLARVFNNVLKNAVAYSPGGSVIDISATVSGDTASVVFTNAGSISRDKLTSIFDKFYRLDSARSSDSGGAGLGLAIAKEIVNSHGGRIFADSGDGRTSFTVELPAAPESESV
jgi:two-component system sensor histidine kinase VanS